MRVRQLALLLVVLLFCLLVGPAAADHNGDLHTDNIRLLSHYPFEMATGLDIENNILVAGSWGGDSRGNEEGGGVYTFNIGNPAEPKLLSHLNCLGTQGNPSISNRTIVQSHDNPRANKRCNPGAGTEGMRLIDASDLGNPQSIGMVELVHGTHTNYIYREEGLVYNSSYNVADPADLDMFQIVDINDPYNPQVYQYEFPGLDYQGKYPALENRSGVETTTIGCHETHVHHERQLLFCAGITETHIMDISDPRKPVILSVIQNPLINIHHGAHPNHEGDILVIGDEWAGALGGPTACTLPESPVGALWFYDISDPTNPQLLSYWAPPDPYPTAELCTAHDLDVFHDREWLTIAWYDQGLFVLDFSDPTNVKQVARYRPEGASLWEAVPAKGHIYATSVSDLSVFFSDGDPDPAKEGQGGLYVFELDGYERSDK